MSKRDASIATVSKKRHSAGKCSAERAGGRHGAADARGAVPAAQPTLFLYLTSESGATRGFVRNDSTFLKFQTFLRLISL